MDILEQVLRRVASGERLFKPVSDSDDDTLDFQLIAEALVHAHESGYLRDVNQHKSATSGTRLYIDVFIVGGLTYEGRQYLAKLDRSSRTMPDVMPDTLFGVPPSGDAKCDDLLRHAVSAFRKHDIDSRKTAVEKLWDAWERLKTLLDTNPSNGNKMLLDMAAREPIFRDMLEHEAGQLHAIGNTFHIRHFKIGTTVEIGRIEHYDYLFLRLFALIHLLLLALHNDRQLAGAGSH